MNKVWIIRPSSWIIKKDILSIWQLDWRVATKADHLEVPQKFTFLSIDDRDRDIVDKCIELETKFFVQLKTSSFSWWYFNKLTVRSATVKSVEIYLVFVRFENHSEKMTVWYFGFVRRLWNVRIHIDSSHLRDSFLSNHSLKYYFKNFHGFRNLDDGYWRQKHRRSFVDNGNRFDRLNSNLLAWENSNSVTNICKLSPTSLWI